MAHSVSLDVLGAEATISQAPSCTLHLTLKPCQRVKNYQVAEVNPQHEREGTNHMGKN